MSTWKQRAVTLDITSPSSNKHKLFSIDDWSPGLDCKFDNLFLLLIKADTKGRGLCNVDSVTTILDGQGVNIAVEGGEDLSTDDAVAHHEGAEEHEPP